MKYACSRCGRTSDQPGGCTRHRRHPNAHRSQHRDRSAQRRFRKAVLERDGKRCILCGSDDDLRATHIVPLRHFTAGDPAAYDPSNGRTLCGDCDRDTDPYAR